MTYLNRHFGFAVLTALFLSGCADKKEATSEQTDAAPAVESQTAHDDQTANADAPAVANQNSATSQTPDAVAKNAPKFAAVTDHLALKDSENWRWQTLAEMPKVKHWQQTLVHDGISYYLAANFDDQHHFSAYGTQNEPKVIVFDSGQAYADSETLTNVSDLKDFFNSTELTRVNSNCNADMGGQFVQAFYKWQKQGSQPLYLVEHQENANSGVTHRFAVAKSFDDFFNPDYNDALPNLQNPNDNEAACTFEL